MSPAVPKPVVIRDPKYLEFLRTLPCHFAALGGCDNRFTRGKVSDVSHLDGKSRDDRALPSCAGHHQTNTISWHHGKATFCRHYGLTESELWREAEAMYRTWKEVDDGEA